MKKNVFLHVKDSCRVHGTLTNQFPYQKPLFRVKDHQNWARYTRVMLIYKNISKIVSFVDWSGKRWKLSQEAQVDFLTTLSAQNVCLDVGFNMEYV